MKPRVCATLSWDDGHPLDMRIAEMMARHGLRGTFYIPRTAECGTISASQVRQLAETFEVGAHTLRHTVLTSVSDTQAQREIAGSRRWIEDMTGRPCHAFCPPQGRYRQQHLLMMAQTGYRLVRTVELVSLDWPRRRAGIWEMPTTVQAWPHDARSYVQNGVKRRAVGNLWRYIRYGRKRNWQDLIRVLLVQAQQCGGVLHLWGHSWEIEDNDAWSELDSVLKFLGDQTKTIPCYTNSEIGVLADRDGLYPSALTSSNLSNPPAAHV